MTFESFLNLAVWGLAAAAAGRLIAQDTVLQRPRNIVLQRLGGLYDAALARKHAYPDGARHPAVPYWEHDLDQFDIAARIRQHGIVGVTGEFESNPFPIAAGSYWRGWAVEGLTCPACVAWWTLTVGAATHWAVFGTLEPQWPVAAFAAWQIAQIAQTIRG